MPPECCGLSGMFLNFLAHLLLWIKFRIVLLGSLFHCPQRKISGYCLGFLQCLVESKENERLYRFTFSDQSSLSYEHDDLLFVEIL